jgi:uncharacterized protein (TIGR02246 family)
MIFRSKTLWALAGLLLVASSAANAAPADDSAIRGLEASQETAWNAHDAHAYAQLFTADATLISALGRQLQSRAEIEARLGDAFASVFAQTRLHIEGVDARSLSDDVALVYVRWSMTGVKGPDGSGGNRSQQGIQTQILRKSDGRWLVLSYQNTIIAPDRPFPTTATGETKGDQPARRCLLASRKGTCVIER